MVSAAEKRISALQQKVHRVELEATVVDDLKREEVMHLSMVQSVRHDLKADFLEKRKAERLMSQEAERRSLSMAAKDEELRPEFV